MDKALGDGASRLTKGQVKPPKGESNGTLDRLAGRDKSGDQLDLVAGSNICISCWI